MVYKKSVRNNLKCQKEDIENKAIEKKCKQYLVSLEQITFERAEKTSKKKTYGADNFFYPL